MLLTIVMRRTSVATNFRWNTRTAHKTIFIANNPHIPTGRTERCFYDCHFSAPRRVFCFANWAC